MALAFIALTAALSCAAPGSRGCDERRPEGETCQRHRASCRCDQRELQPLHQQRVPQARPSVQSPPSRFDGEQGPQPRRGPRMGEWQGHAQLGGPEQGRARMGAPLWRPLCSGPRLGVEPRVTRPQPRPEPRDRSQGDARPRRTPSVPREPQGSPEGAVPLPPSEGRTGRSLEGTEPRDRPPIPPRGRRSGAAPRCDSPSPESVEPRLRWRTRKP